MGQSLGSQIRRLKTSFALSFALDEIMGKPIGFPHKNPRKKKTRKNGVQSPQKRQRSFDERSIRQHHHPSIIRSFPLP